MNRKAPTTAAVRGTINRLAEKLLNLAVDIDTPDLAGNTPWDRVLNAVHGFPRSAAWDSDGGQSSEARSWCWTHERSIKACHDLGETCEGETLAWKDPTGDQAIRRDEVETDVAVCWDQLGVLETAIDDIASTVAKYPPTRRPTDDDAKLADREAIDAGDGCQSCERIAWWSPTYRSSTVGGRLDRQWRLCRWCYDHTLKVGQLPRRRLLQARRDKGTDNPRSAA